MQRWYELSEAVDNWNKTKPSTFDPIWSGEPELGADPFPEIWFTADWHGTHKFLNVSPLIHGT